MKHLVKHELFCYNYRHNPRFDNLVASTKVDSRYKNARSGNAILCARTRDDYKVMDFLKQISLTPHKEEVRIIKSPPDADFLAVSRYLCQKNRSIEDLAKLVARGIVPMVFKTDRLVNGEEATLKLIPQDIKALPDGRGWSWRGQSMSVSSFRKRGNRKDAPITEGTVGSASVNDCFVVV